MQNRQNGKPQIGKKKRKVSENKQPQTPPPVKVRKFVLTKVGHVRAELGRLYAEARNGQINVADASRLGNLLAILHRVIADSDLEQRIAEIEKQLEGGRS
ncbi:MAG: hypothetical protein P4L44_16585 [Oryzomonas sp.]|uniref:hypothetical protein n=1 Tax=Oryzomonas sp. TaxID=2855186 RepID=UPI0028432CAE|nr:hypothetical protein [Oryzomonas sp.]MDR3581580.1 hypothetical protein [Oryzomonas sp.]